MQITTKPFIDETQLENRLVALRNQIASETSISQSGLTLVACTESSTDLTRRLFNLCLEMGIEVSFVQAPVEWTADWVVQHASKWNGCCVLVQDVSNTGAHLQSIEQFCQAHLDCVVRTLIVLDKREDEEMSWSPTWVGFHIPNEFVVGCGMGLHGQLKGLNSIQVLA